MNLLLLLGSIAASLAQPAPVVQTQDGAVRGHLLYSLSGLKYSAFQGIPYARPPIGKHRFKAPVPAKPWSGVWNATSFASECLQFAKHHLWSTKLSLDGDEDCLYLNVFTPQVPRTLGGSPLLDVLVYVHGGAFMYGSGSLFGADYLMDRGDVVVVTLNYRLGILGFLSTEDDVVPGNAGLKDQSMALRWVQSNIAAFGGNPGSVTLAGTSAGGASVHFHMLSPMSRGLFHRAISWSGSALNSWAIADGLREKTLQLANLLGCPALSSRDMVHCFRQRPARALVHLTRHFFGWRYNPCVPFGPTVEATGVNSFLDRHPAEIILNGDFLNIPWMASLTKDEGIFPAADFLLKPIAMQEFSSRFAEVIPYVLMLNYTVLPQFLQPVSTKIQQYYFGYRPISKDTQQNIIKMLGDRLFSADVARAALLHAASGQAPVYFFQFNYRGLHSFSEILSNSDVDFGVSHSDETGYVLRIDGFNTSDTPQDRNVIKLMTDISVNFCKTGDPTPSGSYIKWTRVVPNSQELDYLQINDSSDYTMVSSTNYGNKDFWDSLPINEPQITLPKLYLLKQEL